MNSKRETKGGRRRGAPSVPDEMPYLLDGVGSEYFNWVYITNDETNRTFTNWTLPGHIFSGKVVNSIVTVDGHNLMVSVGSGGTQNIELIAIFGPILFKQLQESVLAGNNPLSIGNQCGREGNL